jgi:N-acetylneuraminic acid mutarotase
VRIDVDRPEASGRRRGRSFESGVGAILMIDALALLLVVASGPAAYLYLDSSRPSPIIATASKPPSPTPGAVATPGAGSSAPGSPAVLSSGSPRPGASLVYGDGSWARTGSLPQPVWAGSSVVLHDGRVMVVGGASGSSSKDAVASAAIFDPATGLWTQVTDMLQPRDYAMAVTLADGSVLVAGGSRDGQPLDTAERYNPASGSWVAAGRLNLPRSMGTLTLLADGRALITGGGIEGAPDWSSTASAELFDPARGTWSVTAPMSVARARQTATLLPDGEVLVAGGATTYQGETGTVTSSVEIYDPRTTSWRAAAPMSKPRYFHGAVLLENGRVLVAGGWYATSNSDPSHATAEIYDPAADKWTATQSMAKARAAHMLVRLPDGRVLAAGGVDPDYHVQVGSELFDPASGAWRASGDLAQAVMWSAAEALPDGRVLVAGGAVDANGTKTTAICQIYTAPPAQ